MAQGETLGDGRSRDAPTARWALLLGGVALAALGADAAALANETEPLELVAVDVSRFPRVVFDVTLPEEEAAGDIDADAFDLPGALDVRVDVLDPADLTLGVVLDDGPSVTRAVLDVEQGSAAELVRNLPPRVELMIATTSGRTMGPSTDRAKAMGTLAPVSGATPPETSLGDTLVNAAARLESVDDPRHQLVVLTADGVDIPADDAARLTASLDRAEAAMRVVTAGASPGPNLLRTALDSGGAAVGVGVEHTAALRAIDVLTTTFDDQFRVAATMPAAGSQVIRLTVERRTYQTVVPGLGPPSAAATPSAPAAGPRMAVPAEAVLAMAGLAVVVAAALRTRRSRGAHAYSPKK